MDSKHPSSPLPIAELRNNKVMLRDSVAAIGAKQSRNARGMPAPFSYAGACRPSAQITRRNANA